MVRVNATPRPLFFAEKRRADGWEGIRGNGNLFILEALNKAIEMTHLHTGGDKRRRLQAPTRAWSSGPAPNPPNSHGPADTTGPAYRRANLKPVDFLRDDLSISLDAIGNPGKPWAASDEPTESDKPIVRANRQIADIYGVLRAFLGSCGTSQLNRLILAAVLRPGDKVLSTRESHGSIHAGVVRAEAEEIWLPSTYSDALGMYRPITPKELSEGLECNPSVKLVVLTAPSYFGLVGDLRGLVDVCHREGVPILLDGAHDEYLAFQSDGLSSAAHSGADFVSLSIHKSLAAPAQGSALLFNTWDEEEIARRFLYEYQLDSTTSPSFPLLAQTELAIVDAYDAFLNEENIFTEASALADQLRQRVADIDGCEVMGPNDVGNAGVEAKLVPTRVTIDVEGLRRTGFDVERELQKTESGGLVVAEMAHLTKVLFMVTAGTTESDIDRVCNKLRELSHERGSLSPLEDLPPVPTSPWPVRRLSPAQAHKLIRQHRSDGNRTIEPVKVDESRDRVSAETISVYPPGSAIIYAGEVIRPGEIEYLRTLRRHDADLKGASDPEFVEIQVFREQALRDHGTG